MIHQTVGTPATRPPVALDVLDLRTDPDHSPEHLYSDAVGAQVRARAILADSAVALGRALQVVLYSWQVQIRRPAGMRVMRAWIPGETVPPGAERLELTAKAVLAEVA